MLITKRKIIFDKVRKNILQPCCKLQGGAAVSAAPTKQTVQTIGGYGIPAIPTQLPNYLPTEATEPTEVSDARYSPTDCTDVHRLGGYGILPYPRSYKTIFPQKPTQPNHLCASVRICGRLFSARSFCEFREFRGRTPRTHQTIFPQKPQKPQKFLAQDILPQNPRNTQKRLAQGILPQIARMCTDQEGMASLPYPRNHKTIFPQNPTQPNHL